VSGSRDKTVRLWDAVTGALLQTLEGYSDKVSLAAFPLDDRQANTLLVSNNWVVEGGIKILWLPPEYRQPSCVAIWSQNLVLGYLSGRVLIIGFEEGSKAIY
jgi:WD40 repeat protein